MLLNLTKDKRYLCHQAYKGLHIFMTGAVSWVRGGMLLIVLDDKSSNDKRYLCHQAYMGLHIFMTNAVSRVLILMMFPGYGGVYQHQVLLQSVCSDA